MQVDIRGQNVIVSEALVAHCVERANRALRPFSSRISRVQFVFVDLNGPKGALGQACRATAELLGVGQVRSECRAEDYYRSVSQTVAGMARHVQRALARRRGHAGGRISTVPPAA
jgi:ribosomal subunit interface protein